MKRRRGFTLVELMVSMALIIFIMAILSQAFIAALNTFRNLKGQGDLAEKLRATAQILQHDLAADHFGSERRLSDPTFWNNGPPQQGFFSVYHGTNSVKNGPVNDLEGFDISGIPSYRSADHKLAFTVKLVGNDIGDFMSASAYGSGNVWDPTQIDPVTGLPPKPVVPQLPGNPAAIGPTYGLGLGAIGIDPSKPVSFGPPESRYQPLVGLKGFTGYNSQWAAVAWFMVASGDTTEADPGSGVPTGLPLYTLYRRQVLLVPDNNLVTLATIPQGALGIPSALIGNFLEISCFPDPKTPNIYFNNPRDITMPTNRVSSWGGQAPFIPIPAGPLLGSDIQLNDVISFDVRVLPLYPTNWTPINPNDPFINLFDPFFTSGTYFNYYPPPGVVGRIFDTWSSYSDGINDYSKWNNVTPPKNGTTIPWWTTSQLTYQYPVGSGRLFQTPATGSGPIIRAIQVTIRIWDFKTRQTRQVTIVQAM